MFPVVPNFLFELNKEEEYRFEMLLFNESLFIFIHFFLDSRIVIESRLFFVMVSVKENVMNMVHGRAFRAR